MILGLFDRLQVSEPEGFDHIHGLVECVKQAFLVRNSHVQDPKVMDVDPIDFLCAADLDARLANIDPEKGPALARTGCGRRHSLDGCNRQCWQCGVLYTEYILGVWIGRCFRRHGDTMAAIVDLASHLKMVT